MWKWLKGLLNKKNKSSSISPNIRKIGSGRKNNIIYPVDELSEQHLNEWLDDVLEKHHGY